jgi:hypothetical protein
MSCMPTSRVGRAAEAAQKLVLRSMNIARQLGGKLWLVDAASFPYSETMPISTTREAGRLDSRC